MLFWDLSAVKSFLTFFGEVVSVESDKRVFRSMFL